MPTLYPASVTLDTDEPIPPVVVGDSAEAAISDSSDDTYIDEWVGDDDFFVTFPTLPANALASSVSPFIRFTTINSEPGVSEETAYSEERFHVEVYDISTAGNQLYARWEGGAQVTPEGDPYTVTYVLNDFPQVDYVETGVNGEWLSYLHSEDGGANDQADYLPRLVTLLKAGDVAMSASRLNDSLPTRDRGIRVFEWGITYSLSGGVQPRRIFQRSL
jgi:hypothetical protein